MEFQNVTLVGAANVYFGGKVSSRTFYGDGGQKKTLGFVLAGEYEFSTAGAERMEILQGVFELCLPGESEYTRYEKGDIFTIPAHISFSVRTDSFSDYCCTYLPE